VGREACKKSKGKLGRAVGVEEGAITLEVGGAFPFGEGGEGSMKGKEVGSCWGGFSA
jgi:hypothetical protein